ncbi:MAG: NAD(+)/NADH kinase, partial [Brevibacterium sp.]|nr:NAD(+)/NADH kinase [Brevibacterium sp.]
QARDLLEWDASLIIVIGGDGTLRSSAPVLSATAVPVLIVPTGTANVLSRHIGIRSAEHALRLVESHLTLRPARMCAVPVNVADCLTADGSRREHFLSLAGIGGDARAVAGRTALPGALGTGLFGYMYGAARALFSPSVNAQIVEANEFSLTDPPEQPSATIVATPMRQVWSVMASRTARPAGPGPVFPHAEAVAEEFEFLAVTLTAAGLGGRLGEWARIASDCAYRRPGANPSMRYWRGTEVSIRVDEAAPVQLDGDLIGDCRRLDLQAGTQALSLLTPH